MRLNIVGTSGSGKSRLGKRLAEVLQIPYVEMDALFWKEQWQETDDEQFFAALEERLEAPHWILDGNYNRTRVIKWARADLIVWIDYGFFRTLYQAFARAMRRAFTQEPLWGTNNTESFKKTLFQRDSILLWTIKTYHRNRQRYLADMAHPDHQHLRFVRLRSPRETRAFERRIQQQWALASASRHALSTVGSNPSTLPSYSFSVEAQP